MITKVKIRGYRKFTDLTLEPNPNLNLIVGANECGKSTLLEAIALGLTGRINGRAANEELNPFWFNTAVVRDFVQSRLDGVPVAWPEIFIELFFTDDLQLQRLSGAHNSDSPTNACPGISFRVLPNPDYADDLGNWEVGAVPILPVEYYMIEWRSFADDIIASRPRQLTTAVIDSRTLRSHSGVDYHMRYILSDSLTPAERASISLAYRQTRAEMSDAVLSKVNKRMNEMHASLHEQPITLAMDQSSRTSWEGAVTPHVDSIPFTLAGQGQQAAIKITLAMSRSTEKATYVMVEEPENHLTHASLTTLLSRIESLAGEHQQLFVTTHSSFVLNRLGLDALLLLGNGSPLRLTALDPETVSYFQKLPGYDTLRMALAKRLVLVEGPSDEIVFERFFTDRFGVRPMELGIDVMSVRGLSFHRCLELCEALDKEVAVIRDNDGVDPEELRAPLSPWLSDGRRQVFIGNVETGRTLEPQIMHHNDEAVLREVLGISETADLAKWMSRQKTEVAIRIAKAATTLNPPTYMRQAAEFIHG